MATATSAPADAPEFVTAGDASLRPISWIGRIPARAGGRLSFDHLDGKSEFGEAVQDSLAARKVGRADRDERATTRELRQGPLDQPPTALVEQPIEDDGGHPRIRLPRQRFSRAHPGEHRTEPPLTVAAEGRLQDVALPLGLSYDGDQEIALDGGRELRDGADLLREGFEADDREAPLGRPLLEKILDGHAPGGLGTGFVHAGRRTEHQGEDAGTEGPEGFRPDSVPLRGPAQGPELLRAEKGRGPVPHPGPDERTRQDRGASAALAPGELEQENPARAQGIGRRRRDREPLRPSRMNGCENMGGRFVAAAHGEQAPGPERRGRIRLLDLPRERRCRAGEPLHEVASRAVRRHRDGPDADAKTENGHDEGADRWHHRAASRGLSRVGRRAVGCKTDLHGIPPVCARARFCGIKPSGRGAWSGKWGDRDLRRVPSCPESRPAKARPFRAARLVGIVLASGGAVASFPGLTYGEGRSQDAAACDRSGVDPDAGIPACTRLIEASPNAPGLEGFFNNRGVGKVRAGDLRGATEDFTRALDRAPRNVDALRNRGIALQMLGELDRAVTDFTAALRMDRRSTALLNARGSALFSKQEFDRAIADFDAALAIDGTYARALTNRGLAYLSKRALGKALQDFNRVLVLRPTDPVGYENRAALFMDKGDFTKAIEDYDAAVKLNPTGAGAYTRRGEVWRVQGNLPQSVADHDKSIELDPTLDAYNNRALALRDQGENERAILDLGEAILLNPKYFLPYANRGDLRRRMGDVGGAVADLDKAVELNPRSPVALTFRGDLRVQRRTFDAALRDYGEALLHVPDFVPAHVGRGQAYEGKADLDAARKAYEAALALPGTLDAALARPAQELARARLEVVAERVRLAAEARKQAEQAKLASLEASRNIGTIKPATESEQRRKAEEEAKARAEFEAKLKAELELRTRQEIERRVAQEVARVRADARTRSESEAKRVAEAEARIRTEIEGRMRTEYDARLNQEVARTEQARVEQARAALPQARGPRVALVIGNAKYRNTVPLANPGNDAVEIAAVLRRLGFEVMERQDLDKPGLEQNLAKFARLARTADAALIYYAGHGLQYQGQNLLVPVDAKLEDEVSLQFELTRLDDVVGALSLTPGARILILDACRNNPLAAKMAGRDGGGYTPGLAKMGSSRGLATVYATQANTVAFDGTGRNSIFTTALVAGLSEPRLEIAQVFRKVAAIVNQRTGGRQSPELSLSLTSEFYFNLGDKQDAVAARAVEKPRPGE